MGVKDAVIVGYDAISPLGSDLESQWQHALAGKKRYRPADPLSAYRMISRFALPVRSRTLTMRTIPFSPPDIRLPGVLRSSNTPCSPSQGRLEQSGIAITPEIAPRIAVTYSSAIGGLDAVLTC